MHDQSFNTRTLSYCFKPIDFQKWRNLGSSEEKEKVIKSAVKRAQTGFLGYQLSSSVIRGKTVYWVNELADILVLRKIKSNIATKNKVKMTPRSVIVDAVKMFISECSQFRLYRLDVKSFYESFDQTYIFKKIDDVTGVDVRSKQLLKEFMYEFYVNGGKGIPRGLSISSFLSDYLMHEFDELIRNLPHVFYYARYVDDIILITDGFEDDKLLMDDLRQALPAGLEFNNKKYFVSDGLAKAGKANSKKPKSKLMTFEYLGYSFSISDNVSECSIRGLVRDVEIDLSQAKINKLKSRIMHSIISYNKNKNFDLLCERLKFLSTNFSVLDSERTLKRLSGIYYNYPMVDSMNSVGLAELDKFLKKAVLSSSGKVFYEFHLNLNQIQKYKVLKFSFVRGHSKCHFFHYSAKKMKRIQECWKYA
ncbi:antiviral reverse transcriptase Drt3a [Pantoea dispersa]|uniref:antiviral reverse transcriptase Drt3a n=1 Tax=Pantoea dispersa TaxID=59814 RepID=UPI0007366EBE|nr:antiviral reverse transcriptase Drt3a [Pantoea dispersa]KTS14716.1 hypothetical protein NS215_21045 [Pantoea dispersa]MDI6634810.1 RNA-directed DNA polymerase [Pantoea dispersa]RVU75836.1 RNA-directed DNA polymerase [Pantoea dispersa]